MKTLVGRSTAALTPQLSLAIILVFAGLAESFYIPGVAPREYVEDELVDVKVCQAKQRVFDIAGGEAYELATALAI